MIGTVEFYKLPGALSTQEYPILLNGQDISSHLVHSIQNCKYTHDLVQGFGPLDIFDDYEDANMMKMDGEFYWIVNKKTRTLKNKETVDFGLAYNAPTSQLRLGNNLTGVWRRTPTNTCPYLSTNVITDAMKASRHINLSSLGTYNYRDDYPLEKLYWVEVCTSGAEVGDTTITKKGLFASFDSVALKPSDHWVYYSWSSSYTGRRAYPRIEDIISEPENYLGVQADQIIQIAISERCPYPYTRERVSDDGKYFNTIRLNGCTPVVVYGQGTLIYTTSSSNAWPKTVADPENITVELTEMERTTGSVRLVNESGVCVATIPTQYGSSMTLQAQTVSDYTGMYTNITYNGRLLASLTEGHLGWIGDAWKQYQARQLESDREMLALANGQARQDLELSLRQSYMSQTIAQVNSVSNMSLFTPISGAASAVLSIAETGTQSRLERETMRLKTAYEVYSNNIKQELTEKMMKAEPGTCYSMGYGLIYCFNTIQHPTRIQVEMPANLTQAYFNSFMDEFGWPAEGKQTLTLSEGYLQGQIIADGTVVGEKFDELVRTVGNGIKMKAIT